MSISYSLHAIRDTAFCLRFCPNTSLYSLRDHCTPYGTRKLHAGVRQRPKFVFLGPPGVGKGTYARILGQTWKIPHISIGDLFRQEIAANTPVGQFVKEICARGELVPDKLVLEICRRRLVKVDCSSGWILDGFPRTVNQATMLRTFAPPTMCVNLLLRRDILLKKLLARRICADCGLTFNIAEYFEGPYELPPVPPPEDCEKCRGNATLVKRPDDSESTIKRRLELYDEQTVPILRLYEEENKLFKFEMKKGLKDVPNLAAHILARLRYAGNRQGSLS